MSVETFPWFQFPRLQKGSFCVTWWTRKRNRRGTVTLHPNCVSFATFEDACAAARLPRSATVAKVTMREGRGIETTI